MNNSKTRTVDSFKLEGYVGIYRIDCIDYILHIIILLLVKLMKQIIRLNRFIHLSN